VKASHRTLRHALPIAASSTILFLSKNILNDTLFRYHFETPDNCYINYRHAPDSWLLDDGKKMPEKKMFEDCRYDASTRTFHANIRWSESPVDGSVLWVYRMVFSDDFCIIANGEVKAFDTSDNLLRSHRYPHSLRYWRRRSPPASLAGCVFIQGGVVGLAS
jgi:hypothetical protein